MEEQEQSPSGLAPGDDKAKDSSITAKIVMLKGLWALGGAALATAAGVALFYIYMWNIGGVPIAQLSSVAVFSKIIVPAALFICMLLLGVWLTPLMVVAGLLSHKVDLSLKRLFYYAPTEPSIEGPSHAPTPDATENGVNTAPIEAPAPNSGRSPSKAPRVNVRRVIAFAASTAGVASLWPIAMLMAPHVVEEKAPRAYWFGASGAALFLLSLLFLRILWSRSEVTQPNTPPALPPLMGLRLGLMNWGQAVPARARLRGARSLDWVRAKSGSLWNRFKLRLARGKLLFLGWILLRPLALLGFVIWLPFETFDRVWVSLTTSPSRRALAKPAPAKESFWTVAAAGVAVGFISLMPYLILMLVLFSDETFVKDLTDLGMVLSLVPIGLSITGGFACSLGVILSHRKDGKMQWRPVLLINALVLCGVLFGLKVQGHLLNRVMVLSSVRIEHANVFLEAEGCEILAAMSGVGGGVGWTPSPTKDSKACMLYNVTVQSSLDPALQIACWRTPPVSGTQASARGATPTAPPASAALPPTSSSAASGVNMAAPAVAKPSNFRTGSSESNQVSGFGSFSMPTKYVRNAWKIGHPIAEIVTPVCPQDFNLERLEALASGPVKEAAAKPSPAASEAVSSCALAAPSTASTTGAISSHAASQPSTPSAPRPARSHVRSSCRPG
jgi:hypothetical protein